ncbi:MAG: DUF4280 domain-containing protein [Polyangiaceae bacterium]|nr:DUF4280 domain-containing protein [Polyangiaceae bacterium]
MPKLVLSGAVLKCSMGSAPGTLTVLPSGFEDDEKAIATILDHKPNVNIAPFGMCQSMANPQVASATAAAQGVLTPQPCVPMTTTPWSPGATVVTINEIPALTDSSKCNCMWAGLIEITSSGTDKEVT